MTAETSQGSASSSSGWKSVHGWAVARSVGLSWQPRPDRARVTSTASADAGPSCPPLDATDVPTAALLGCLPTSTTHTLRRSAERVHAPRARVGLLARRYQRRGIGRTSGAPSWRVRPCDGLDEGPSPRRHGTGAPTQGIRRRNPERFGSCGPTARACPDLIRCRLALATSQRKGPWPPARGFR
jgi:hypothetical protein